MEPTTTNDSVSVCVPQGALGEGQAGSGGSSLDDAFLPVAGSPVHDERGWTGVFGLGLQWTKDYVIWLRDEFHILRKRFNESHNARLLKEKEFEDRINTLEFTVGIDSAGEFQSHITRMEEHSVRVEMDVRDCYVRTAECERDLQQQLDASVQRIKHLELQHQNLLMRYMNL